MNETPERSSLTLDNLGSDQALSKNPDSNTPNSSLCQIIRPLISKVKLLRESFHKDISSMDSKLESAIEVQKSEFSKLEENITIQRKEITTSLSSKIETNTTNINQLLEENRKLKTENCDLREWLTRLT